MTDDEFKLELKAFLKRNRFGYGDVASLAFVSEATVRNWMAQKKIPAAKKKLLRDWMTTHVAANPEPSTEESVHGALGREVALLLRKLQSAYPDIPPGDVATLVTLAMRDAL